ncbi:hypothetical protein [Variovorax guangxiensis]|uniref:hypothetical protein n=1 Tax=Variovorax guangxiensis TaxID=1775474 RepID=UPI00285987E9|nr:hypothetical protein [Variovorax guangxiensis]MDR6857226.1 hypothetical protein [Variovorax guangxiensis]
MKGKRLQVRLTNLALAREKKRPASKPTIEMTVSMHAGDGREAPRSAPPDDFDVWNSTEAEVIALIRAGRIDAPGPLLAQWTAASLITRNRARIEASGPALMDAISRVAKEGLVMPAWMAEAYLVRYSKIEKLEVGSFDEAFGPLPFKPGQRLKNLNQRRRLIPLVSRALIDALNAEPTRAIDADLFEEVGKKFGYGHTTTEQIYREGVQDFGMQDIRLMKELLLFPFK